MFDINDIAKQISASLALQEAKVRESEAHLGKLKADIDNILDEKEAAKAEAAKVKAECTGLISYYKGEVEKARGELNSIVAQVRSQHNALAEEKSAHVSALAALRGSYAKEEKDLRDNIAQLKKRRDDMREEARAFLAKWSDE